MNRQFTFDNGPASRPRTAGLAVVLAIAWAAAGVSPASAEVLPGRYFDTVSMEAALAPVAPAASRVPDARDDSARWTAIDVAAPVLDASLVAAAGFAPIPSPDPRHGAGSAASAPVPASLIDADIVDAALAPIVRLDGVATAGTPWLAASGAVDECPALLDHSYRRLQGGQTQSLCDYRGKVLLVVNTASYCGYTHQYEGLEALHRKYADRGLVVVGFPSNDFGAQEPGTNKEIAEFCRTTYGVQFPMFEKSSVAGVATNPLFAELAARTGERPQWNFHKYLIDHRGQKVASFRSTVAPDSRELVRMIEQLLAEPAGAARG